MKTVKKPSVCPSQMMMHLLSKRHMLMLIYTLSNGEKGYNDLQEELSINTATLAKRLKELDTASIVEMKRCTKDTRIHYYMLTKRGHRLSKLISKFGEV